jgi:uncharacterized membrane protein YphA (DoxX/SURF4 family)
MRMAIGTYLVSSGLLGGLLSIVEPMSPADPNLAAFAAMQVTAGVLLASGLLTRIAAVALMVLFASSLAVQGMAAALDQIMLLGVGIALLFTGGSAYSLDRMMSERMSLPKTARRMLALADRDGLFLPSLRIAFGANLIWLGLTEKMLAPEMFMAVMEKFGMSPVGVDPTTAAFGAGFIELAIGAFYLLGIRMRVVSVAMFGILIFTVVTFGESAIAHVVMFAIAATFAIRGRDPLTVVEPARMSSVARRIRNVVLLRMYADSD